MAVPVETDGPQFHSGAPLQLFEGNPGTDYAVTRDGSRFLMLEVIPDQPFVETPVTITLNWQAALK